MDANILVNRAFFLKNTQILFDFDQILAYELRRLESFSFTVSKDENGINFKNEHILLYENPNEEFIQKRRIFKNDYHKYPVLFFYGFGNGMLYKSLCKNERHKHIIIFEHNLEILALALHLFDFTQEIKKEQLILFYAPNLNMAQLSALFSYELIQKSVKIYNLFIHAHFYEKFHSEQIQRLNTQIIDIIRFMVLNKGNDPCDSLMGIEHSLHNLPRMLSHGIFQEFIKQRRFKAKTAIIVSTGPSLTKQLSLLKKYAHKASIFCADSSYSILAKHDIRPDYVLSLERIHYTSEFFNNDFGSFDKNILFIIASLTHKNTLDYLEKNNRTYMLVQRPLKSLTMLELDAYGYMGVGHSVANMAFELASVLGHENIILIGQDLAYAKNGDSHPKDYLYLEKADQEGLYTMAYGGRGEVKTQLTWNLFRQAFQKDIFWAKEKLNISTYNCTEGGARIEGSIERSFLWACKNLLHEDLDKPFAFPKTLDPKSAKEKLERTKELLKKNLLESKQFIEKSQFELQKLRAILQAKQYRGIGQIRHNVLKLFREFKNLKLFNEISEALYFHNECEILKFEVLSEQKQDEGLVEFLKVQYNWFIQSLAYLQTQNQSIEQGLKQWGYNEL